MTEQEVRAKFLEIIIAHHGACFIDKNIETARKCTDFVIGKNDAEVIRAAEELAKAIEKSCEQPRPSIKI